LADISDDERTASMVQTWHISGISVVSASSQQAGVMWMHTSACSITYVCYECLVV